MRSPPPRGWGRIAFAVVFALLACGAWLQVVLRITGDSDDPPALVILQAIIGATAAATAWGAWRGARMAPWAAIAYGLATAGMLVALGPMLDLPAEATGGLYLGAVVVLGFAVIAAWFLHRAVRRTT